VARIYYDWLAYFQGQIFPHILITNYGTCQVRYFEYFYLDAIIIDEYGPPRLFQIFSFVNLLIGKWLPECIGYTLYYLSDLDVLHRLLCILFLLFLLYDDVLSKFYRCSLGWRWFSRINGSRWDKKKSWSYGLVYVLRVLVGPRWVPSFNISSLVSSVWSPLWARWAILPIYILLDKDDLPHLWRVIILSYLTCHRARAKGESGLPHRVGASLLTPIILKHLSDHFDWCYCTTPPYIIQYHTHTPYIPTFYISKGLRAPRTGTHSPTCTWINNYSHFQGQPFSKTGFHEYLR